MSFQNPENEQKIDNFIAENPDCKIPKTQTITLNGQNHDLETFRLPMELTVYNIKNGRFAAEYIDLVKKEGELDPWNSEDSKKIQQLLLEIDPKQSLILQKDLQVNGQKDPGIITHDGQVINGNRRRAALEELVSSGNSQFKFIEVSRLPPNVSSQDLWKIEAGIQLSRKVQLDYGPINELLKFQQGIEAGLTPLEIAKSLYGGFKESEILEKLEILKLITEYLRFIGEPGVFNRAKGVHEQFIDLRRILETYRKQSPSPDEIVKFKHIAFQLFHDGITQRETRKLRNLLENAKTKQELFSAEEHSKPEKASVKRERRIKADMEDEYTPARTIFNNCLDSEKAISESLQPERLLKRALTNLENIDTEHSSLDKPDIQTLISEVETALKRLKS